MRTVRRPRSAVRRALLAHLGTGLAVLVLVAVGATVFTGRVVADQVTGDAKAETHGIALAVVAPHVNRAVRAQDPQALQQLDQAVRARTSGSTVVRIKVWDDSGRVLYSDAPRLIGRRFPLGAEELGVLRSAGGQSEVSDVSRPENQFEHGLGPVIETYVGMRDADGSPVLVEAYFSAAGLHAREAAISKRVTAVSLAALAFLGLLLLPMSVRLARRVERYERERLAMVRLAVEASADERRRLARELHDGVIQALAGSRYVLASVERQLAELRLAELQGTVRITTDVLLHEIDALRTLTTALFSSRPGHTDVREVLLGLARDVEQQGLTVHVDVGELPALPIQVTEAVTHVAREALRNVAAHSGAEHARLTLSATCEAVHLVVADDGRGFDVGSPEATRPGHLGLRLLAAAADRVGGRLDIRRGQRRGTVVALDVPFGAGRPGAQRSSGEWLDGAAVDVAVAEVSGEMVAAGSGTGGTAVRSHRASPRPRRRVRR